MYNHPDPIRAWNCIYIPTRTFIVAVWTLFFWNVAKISVSRKQRFNKRLYVLLFNVGKRRNRSNLADVNLCGCKGTTKFWYMQINLQNRHIFLRKMHARLRMSKKCCTFGTPLKGIHSESTFAQLCKRPKQTQKHVKGWFLHFFLRFFWSFQFFVVLLRA